MFWPVWGLLTDFRLISLKKTFLLFRWQITLFSVFTFLELKFVFWPVCSHLRDSCYTSLKTTLSAVLLLNQAVFSLFFFFWTEWRLSPVRSLLRCFKLCLIQNNFIAVFLLNHAVLSFSAIDKDFSLSAANLANFSFISLKIDCAVKSFDVVMHFV